ncbi:MAG: DNA-directed RNA polymerase subunit H [Candidatus Aenigmarchaeota archaeon]|nr:DNA-directed RNA polymerase subunit H [Candidatus Aenigmarchaeota archaeon]
MTVEFDLLNHELVPKQEIAKKDEIDEILKKYNITKEQLPKIKSKDPVVKRIGAKDGDVIKSTRKSPTAGVSIYYRIVVR